MRLEHFAKTDSTTGLRDVSPEEGGLEESKFIRLPLLLEMASKVKHRHIKAKHQKKRYFRANDPLLSVFMWGVNQTVSSVTCSLLSSKAVYVALALE